MELTSDLGKIESESFVDLWAVDDYCPPTIDGIYKFTTDLGRGARLDSLFVNKSSDVLLVSLHGATQRSTIRIPRFERLRTFLRTSCSSIYFGDPSLYLSEKLSLSWFTGWREVNVPHLIADWVQKAADASGATRIVFVGSSGGGFASAQVSAHVPGSVAVLFNPQTSISAYRPRGSLGYGRNFMKHVMPELTPADGLTSIDGNTDWSAPMRDRGSMISRYARPAPNYLLYVQNDQDHEHWHDHYTPFREAVENGPNAERIRFSIYSGPEGHSAPPRELFDSKVDEAIGWIDDPGCTQ